MTAELKVRADGLEARVPAGMRKLRRAPRPGEKSRNLGVRLSQKAGADPAGPRSQPRHVPGPSPSCGRRHPRGFAGTGSRIQRGSPHPRGPGRDRGSAPALGGGTAPPRPHPHGCRVSHVPPLPPSARLLPGRPLPRAIHSLWMPSGHLPGKVQLPQCAHIPLLRARARLVWSPALPGIRAEPACVAGPAGVPLLRPEHIALVDGR